MSSAAPGGARFPVRGQTDERRSVKASVRLGACRQPTTRRSVSLCSSTCEPGSRGRRSSDPLPDGARESHPRVDSHCPSIRRCSTQSIVGFFFENSAKIEALGDNRSSGRVLASSRCPGSRAQAPARTGPPSSKSVIQSVSEELLLAADGQLPRRSAAVVWAVVVWAVAATTRQL